MCTYVTSWYETSWYHDDSMHIMTHIISYILFENVIQNFNLNIICLTYITIYIFYYMIK